MPEEVHLALKEVSQNPDYNREVRPILSDKCFSCHGPDANRRQAGLRLDRAIDAYSELPESPGKVAIKPGNLYKSEVFHRIISEDSQYRMPEVGSHLSLSAREKAVLIRWVENGATYLDHWAFVPPFKVKPPGFAWPGMENHAIDRFVRQRLRDEGWQLAAPAAREILLRRVSLDLTGLPPSLEELDAFLRDPSPEAYEKQVDRLLASPHFGEKMAVHWLDVARFADSHGYTVDRLRDMSPYRDWVIKAFNDNMPYDQFCREQLAGDLDPRADRAKRIATAFNRNHPQNMEGGIIEEEFQMEYAADRTNTFGEAFLGLSLGCARCHDHKFDPVSQQDYYQVYAFFNRVKEAGQISWNSAVPTPALMLPTREQEEIIQFIRGRIDRHIGSGDSLRAAGDGRFRHWLNTNGPSLLAREKVPLAGLMARYTFEGKSLRPLGGPMPAGRMKTEAGMDGGKPVFTPGSQGLGLQLDGDTYLDLGPAGVFRKAEPFTIGMDIRIPKEFREGVLFHKSEAERLYNFRGFHLYFRDGQLEASMAHTAPSNAITRIAKGPIPREKWLHVALVYDGSGTAKGMKIYLEGKPMEMVTTMDQLTKDILFDRNPEPGLQIGAWWRGLGFRDGRVDNITIYSRELSSFEVSTLAGKDNWRSMVTNAPAALSPVQQATLRRYWENAVDRKLRDHKDTLTALRNRLADQVEKIAEIMVMEESPFPPKTHILGRGHYENKGKEVFPATPAAILPFPEHFQKNRDGLARWLFLPGNPLTARVAVNRFWQVCFGKGLVDTPGDFGNQGGMPSHPELLDWLAIAFRESGWNMKWLIRTMVLSATYRQSSWVPKAIREKDPENRLLARGPSERLSAEMIRDNGLFASGLLNKALGGKSFRPYQPNRLWEINSAVYESDTGSTMYRRSLYILIKRSVPHPLLSTFDAGSRSFCVVQRQRTNTPLQALLTLNDPTYVEISRVMAQNMQAQPDERQAIAESFRRLTARRPNSAELRLLIGLRRQQEKAFRSDPRKARGWLHTGQHRYRPGLDTARLAAHAVVISTILNSDAALTKR